MLLQHLAHFSPPDQRLPIKQLLLLPCLSQNLTCAHLCPSSTGALEKEPPCHLIHSYLEPSFYSTFFTTLFHHIGILYRQCQSPVVTKREPGPRPLSLVHPTVLGAQRERSSPMHRTVLMRTHSLPSHGLRFPALPPVDARLIEGYREDDYGLTEYFC